MREKKVFEKREEDRRISGWVCACLRERKMCVWEEEREASVTDSAKAAVKGSPNTAGGEKIGAKKPEGYTLLEERKRGWEEGRRVTKIQSWKSDWGEEEREFSPSFSLHLLLLLSCLKYAKSSFSIPLFSPPPSLLTHYHHLSALKIIRLLVRSPST